MPKKRKPDPVCPMWTRLEKVMNILSQMDDRELRAAAAWLNAYFIYGSEVRIKVQEED